jgi:16S rRNA (uracil1498-N3)-methyltransferase
MECLYAPHLRPDISSCPLADDEYTHARALRLREGSSVLLSNGAGLCAEALVRSVGKSTLECMVQKFLPHHNELHTALHLALGVLDNRERMEIALEKATELGIVAFTPLLADHSQRERVNLERLQAKALAAMKQSQRSYLPRIAAPVTVDALLQNVHKASDTRVILADAEGQAPARLQAEGNQAKGSQAESNDVWLVIGPEGGFSERELYLLNTRADARWRLGASRLRAETAAILAVGTAALLL